MLELVLAHIELGGAEMTALTLQGFRELDLSDALQQSEQAEQLQIVARKLQEAAEVEQIDRAVERALEQAAALLLQACGRD